MSPNVYNLNRAPSKYFANIINFAIKPTQLYYTSLPTNDVINI